MLALYVFYGCSSHSISSIACAEFGNVDRTTSTKAFHQLLLPPVEYQATCGISPDNKNKGGPISRG